MKKWLALVIGLIAIAAFAMLLRDESNRSKEPANAVPAAEPQQALPAQGSMNSTPDQQEPRPRDVQTGVVGNEDLPDARLPDSVEPAPFPVRQKPAPGKFVELEIVEPSDFPEIAAAASRFSGGGSAGGSQVTVNQADKEASVPLRSPTGGNPPESDLLLPGPGEGSSIDQGPGPGGDVQAAPGRGPGEGWEGEAGPAPEDSPSTEVYPQPGENTPDTDIPR